MNDPATDDDRVLMEIQANCRDLADSCIDHEISITADEIHEDAREWAYEADWHEILLLLDKVQTQRDPAWTPETLMEYYEPEDDLPFMRAIREAGSVAMRHAMMDHLGMLDMAEFSCQDDYKFKRDTEDA